MKRLKRYGNHECCPDDFKRTQDLTGAFTMDAVIQKNPNKDMAARLEDHLMEDVAYKINTAYGRGSID